VLSRERVTANPTPQVLSKVADAPDTSDSRAHDGPAMPEASPHAAAVRAAAGRFEGRDLGCVRGDRAVFAGLDFALEPGGALVLTGPNGSGKSSLLRVLSGLLPPAAGDLRWAGRPVADDPEAHRAHLHYQGHHEALKPELTAAENLGFWAGLHGGGAAAVADALERFELDGLAEEPVRLLSAGQRRRLSLARVLASPAPLWLLDEPSVGLDRRAVRRLVAEIEAHRAAGGLVVLATHQPLGLTEETHLSVADFPPAEVTDADDPWAGALW
jgi:heme exporter protein A